VVLLFGVSLLVGALLTAAPREVPGMAIATVLGGAWLSMVLALTLPTRRERAGAELTRRLGEFRHAVNAAGDSPARADLERLLSLGSALGLRDDEIGDELVSIRAALEGLVLAEQLAAGHLPSVPSSHASADDTCRFTAAVRFGRRRADQSGHLVLTDGWLKFRGAFDVSVAWTEITHVERAGADVIVSLAGSRRLLRFACQTIADATRGGVIAAHLLKTNACARESVLIGTDRSQPA
jgi:hypothetical protein